MAIPKIELVGFAAWAIITFQDNGGGKGLDKKHKIQAWQSNQRTTDISPFNANHKSRFSLLQGEEKEKKSVH